DRVDVGTAAAIELVLDHIEEPTMQPLDQRQGFEVKWTDMVEARFALGRLHRLGNGFHHDALFLTLSLLCGEALFFPAHRPPYAAGSKIGLNNTIKIRFICNGECSIELTIQSVVVTVHSR